MASRIRSGRSAIQDESLTPFEQAKAYFEYANAHPILTRFREKMREDYGFYDSDGQWDEAAKQALKKRNQAVTTVNKIKYRVNNLAGIEIQTRFRIAFRSHSGKPEEDKLTSALTHYAYAIQEEQDMPRWSSLMFKDCLITGIGWNNLFKDKNGITCEYVHPANMVFDPDDLTVDFREMEFVGRLRWMSLRQAKRLWPNQKEYFDNLSVSPQAGSTTGEIGMRQSSSVDLYKSGDGQGLRVLIVEVQYREYEKAYRGFDGNGHPFETFSKKQAFEFDPKGDFETFDASKIQRVLFSGDVLLEAAPLKPMLPNMPDFTYIPIVWSRVYSTGEPDGWVGDLKDLQRESNYRRAKLVNNLSSTRAVIDSNAMPGLSVEQVREELKRPDSVIVKTPGSELKIESNMPLATGQFEMLERTDREMQEVSGLHDDAVGKPTNAESGVAIQARQVNSVRNQVHIFDSLRIFKKRQGRLLLQYLQGGGDLFMESQILSEDERETVLLNVVRDVNGQSVVLNDVRTLPIGVFVEDVPDFESQSEEQQANLTALLGNANAMLLMQSPAFMKRMRIRDYDQIASEMQGIMKQSAPPQGQPTGGSA